MSQRHAIVTMKNRFQKADQLREKLKKKNFKSARLVVRNLPFKSDEGSVKKLFSNFGTVHEVVLLKKGEKSVGCGFVQFDNRLNAAKAISKTSGKLFNGRPIIVDWAVPKNRFEEIVNKSKGTEAKGVKIKEEESVSVKDELDDVKEELDEVKVKIETDDDSGKNSDSDLECNSEDSVSDDDVSSELSGMKLNEKYSTNQKKFEDNIYEEKTSKKVDDTSDGRTVFLQNVPFQATNSQLKLCAEKMAGPVEYAVICTDPLTEHSKGTAFVKFKEKEVADEILSQNKKLTLLGNVLSAFQAVKKNELARKVKAFRDKRNLYLIKEGIVLAGTPAAVDVSEKDMAKRLLLEQERSRALQNMHKFISPTRLIIHNLPIYNFDNKKLLELFKNHSPKGAKITEARVMRNLNEFDEKGIPISKGFGFVSFVKHEDALSALRVINNNPDIFTKRKRPIVSFSVENQTAINIKKRREEKLKAGQDVKGSDSVGKDQAEKSLSKEISGGPEVDDNPKRPFTGVTALPGSRKLHSRKKLLAQAQLHRENIRKEKWKKKSFKVKLSRKQRIQKRINEQMSMQSR